MDFTGLPIFDGPHPDAWCSSCEDRRVEAGGDWTPEVEAELGIQILCGSCYESAKRIWSKARTT